VSSLEDAPPRQHGSIVAHLAPLALFTALAMAWTWPLVRHLGDAIPGEPGDNYSFLWNLWWMRHVLATPGATLFRTTHLFFPFGTTLADHPHTALPAFIAATLLQRASIVTAQNLLLIAYLIANMASMYALAWDVTRHRRASVFAAVMFGTSPYVAAHLLGHFDLVAVWPLPLFALLLRRALASGSKRAAAGAGAVLAMTAYIAYYYVVYLWFFTAVYLVTWLNRLRIEWPRRPQTRATRRARLTLAVAAALFGAAALLIAITGGRTVHVGRVAVSAGTPQNALTAVWLCAIGVVLTRRQLTAWRNEIPRARRRGAVRVAALVAAVFLAGASPLLWQAARLVASGEYVTPAYQWRSAPRGVDLVAPLLGPPRHPLLRAATGRAYAAMHLDQIEAVGWIGVVPALLLLAWRAHGRVDADRRIWCMVAIAFAVWALGPFLTVAGFNTGLHLPETLLRFVPFASNAHMPGRAMVGVFMAAAVLLAAAMSRAAGRWGSPAVQWLLVALVVVDYWDAPIPLTMLDAPAVYQVLAAAPPGAVCEVPFGVGDGLSSGTGSQDRRILFYATQHEHPLVGGYIGRMPARAAQRYESMPIAGALLRLSDGRDVGALPPGGAGASPCRYLVVRRDASSAALLAYVATLPLARMASADGRDLYRVR
jgi:hypothetical protein